MECQNAKMIPKTGDPRRDVILTAAFECFVNYGFRRTSMEDIAGAAGLSRPTLYQTYRNKADIFRAFVEATINVVVKDVRRAFDGEAPIEDRLMAALDRGFLQPHRELAATPHGVELIGVNKEIAGDLFERWMSEMEDALADGLSRATGHDSRRLARLLVNAVEGAKTRNATNEAVERDVRDMVHLVMTEEYA